MNTYSQREAQLQQFRDSIRTNVETASEDNTVQDLSEGALPLMRKQTEATPFPIDALNPILREGALAIHERTQAPLAICGQAVLSVAALFAQAHVDVMLPQFQRCPVSLFMVTVAESSERKSSVDVLANLPAVERSKELREAYDADKLEFRNKSEIYEQARKGALSAREKASDKNKVAQCEADLRGLGSEPTPPPKPLIVFQEATIEGLIKLLLQGLGWGGLFSSEGAAFLAGHGMNQDNKLKTIAVLSTIWDGGVLERIRQSDELMALCGRRMSAHLMIQGNIAERMFSDDDMARQGILSRILFTAPATTAGTRLFKAPSEPALAAHQRYVDHMLDIARMPPQHAEGKPAELTPRVLVMDAAAEKIWADFYNFIEERIAPTREYSAIRAWAGKLPMNVGRIAGVLAFVDDPTTGHITASHMESAVRLGGHYLHEALRLFEAGHVAAELTEASRLLDWIRPRGHVYLQQVYQFGPNFVRTAATARKLLGILTENRWLEKLEHGAVIDGRQRRDVWTYVGGAQ